MLLVSGKQQHQEDTMNYTAVGTTDENTTCDCCGKPNLKMTVVLRDDEGDFHYFGRTCAARATGWKAAYLDRQIIAADNKRNTAARTLATWTAYLADGEAGITRFIHNNQVAISNNPHKYPNREAVAASIRETVEKLTAEAAMPTQQARG
jgi:hypothetical protein